MATVHKAIIILPECTNDIDYNSLSSKYAVYP